jgi:uncharacterized protein (TIGR02588 family)
MASGNHESAPGKSANQAAAADAPQTAPSDRETASEIPFLEWLVGGIGLILIASVIAVLIYRAVSVSDSPPDLVLEVISVQRNRSGYLVTTRVRNNGGSTAEGVVIEGAIKDGLQILERSHTTLDYAPPRSEKRVGLFFTRDPRRFDFQLRALGYEEP